MQMPILDRILVIKFLSESFKAPFWLNTEQDDPTKAAVFNMHLEIRSDSSFLFKDTSEISFLMVNQQKYFCLAKD
ncbi:hypothetical protein BpHYR1_036486 [Brachionus plicatilis]|uniref:Uncharacterized protein n=1 Tax=Brachionus plicatilis TaxID=10195 RepID=A0A3M7RUE8_BRAPC|nr:hypothetical protein BpHYR1_036486 [Brachionus plicatilis]